MDLKPGDIIAYSGRGWLSDVINLCTYGIPRNGISHVGIVAKAQGKLLVFESTSLDGKISCEITGKPIIGTQAHTTARILDLYNGSVWHYPLYRKLYADEDTRLSLFLLNTIGVKYDEMGALRSAGIGLSWIESLFRDESLSTIFCSEWVAAALSNVGILPTDNVSRWNPNRLIRRGRRLGIFKKPVRLK